MPDFLAIEEYHSIIDKYITLIRILQAAVLKNKKDEKAFLDSRIYYLSKKVKDFNIYKLRLLIDTNFDFNHEANEKDLTSLKVLDHYTNAEYHKAESILEEFLLESPLSIELYEIYLKTLVLQNKRLKPLGLDENSFQNRILKALYRILLREDSIEEYLNEIRKIAFNISSISPISYYLMNFYKEEVDGKHTLKLQSLINTNFLNPTFLNLLNESCITKNLATKFNRSTSLTFLNQLKNGTFETIKKSQLSTERKKSLNAHLKQKNELYEDAIVLWDEMLSNESLKNFQKEKILQNLFRCYEKLSQYNSCIELYVDSCFENPSLVSNIDVDFVINKIKTSKYKNVNHNIKLPLFFKLTNSEDYDIHTAYECYLLAQNCTSPTELIASIKNNVNDKVIYFLRDICTLDVFKHSPFITSSKHKYNERIDVCEQLKVLDNNLKSEYNNEIERLTKRLIIQKGIQEVDESKIYVNQTGIIETELKNILPIYRRFKMIGELKSEKDISILSLYSPKIFSYKISGKKGENELSKDPQFDTYKDIFYFLREQFLFSNYGLQQYLSARIRHGVLLGEIRPVFENLDLITEKEKDIDSYKANKNWEFYFVQLSEEEESKFQKILSNFSFNIDALINEEILLNSLQIKIEEKNPLGWLDYNYDDLSLQLLYVLHKEIDNVEEFANAIFSSLWLRTEKNLYDIKTKISGEIKEKFFELLLKLETGFINVFGDIPDMLEININEARVNIENKLTKIANWFSITESNISDFQIEKIVDVSFEYNKSIKLVKEIDCNCQLKGSFYPPLVDLVRIFMDNASKHAGFNEENVALYVSIKEDSEIVKIQFRNPLANTIDEEELRSKICSFRLDLTMSMKERGSGFHKAMRIIKSDLNHSENNMTLSLNDTNEFCVEITLNKKTLLA